MRTSPFFVAISAPVHLLVANGVGALHLLLTDRSRPAPVKTLFPIRRRSVSVRIPSLTDIAWWFWSAHIKSGRLSQGTSQ
jgi:hypothetical protein